MYDMITLSPQPTHPPNLVYESAEHDPSFPLEGHKEERQREEEPSFFLWIVMWIPSQPHAYGLPLGSCWSPQESGCFHMVILWPRVNNCNFQIQSFLFWDLLMHTHILPPWHCSQILIFFQLSISTAALVPPPSSSTPRYQMIFSTFPKLGMFQILTSKLEIG